MHVGIIVSEQSMLYLWPTRTAVVVHLQVVAAPTGASVTANAVNTFLLTIIVYTFIRVCDKDIIYFIKEASDI